jgi:hypothetical protein
VKHHLHLPRHNQVLSIEPLRPAEAIDRRTDDRMSRRKTTGTTRSTGFARAQMMAFCKLFTDAPVDTKRTLLAGVSSKKLFAELHC